MKSKMIYGLAALMILAAHVSASVLYVNVNNPTPLSPFGSWNTAATSIQDAIDAASANDTVLVTNGVYKTGGRPYPSSTSTTNRVLINKSITVQSVNGPNVTTILGYQVPVTTNGSTAVRCVSISGAATVISGFTLTGGATTVDESGGGVTCINGMVTNCVIIGNCSGNNGGGGVFASGSGIFARIYNCIISSNSTSGNGGGINCGAASIRNCLVSANYCGNNNANGGGGGVYSLGLAALNNCTIANNSANYSSGGGIVGGNLTNCIIYYNNSMVSQFSPNISQSIAVNCCTIPTNNLASGSKNITNSPGFFNADGGDFRLMPWSFCLDNGTTNADIGDVDLASHPRVIGSAVDLGAYEYQQDFTQTVHYVHPPISFPFNANTNVMSPYTNWVTAATNIQDAIDVAAAGDFIVVSNGIYATGGRAAYGFVTNRVTVNKPITLISLSGAKYTAIQGSPTGVRCAYVADGASIIGFTLSNGAAMFNGDNLTNQNGGGVWCQSPLATLSNCVITTCSSANQGGGAYSGTLVACTISYSHANNSGGGVAFGTLLNCMVTTNFSTVGGGTFSSLLAGCTLLNNNSSQFGGGAAGGILTNCLLARNYSFSKGGGACSNSLTDCILNSNWLSGPLSSKLPISGGGAYSCTLTNCMLAGNAVTNGDGGGAAFGLLIGCALANNLATYGGGAYSNTLNGCYLVSNSASSYGGGAAFANLTNCPIIFNTAYYGGGTAFGTCYDCLLTNNYAVGGSGGAIYSNTTVNCTLDGYSFYTSYGSKLSRCIYNANTSSYQDILDNCQFNGFFNAANGNLIISGVLNNCTIILPFFQSSTYPPIQYCMATNSIIYGFYPANSPHLSASQSFFDHCCTSFSVSGSGNFTNAPLFIESYSALTNPPPFHLATNSPCINAGDSSLVVNLMDLDGFPRVVGGAVDIGATEFQDASVTNVINMEPFIAWLGQNGLPTDGSANYVDSDGDHMNNWQEWLAGTSPTNALSVLQLAPPVFINYPSRVVLTWQSTTNRNYYLQDCSDLKNGFVTIQNNIIGRAGTTSFTNYLMTNSSSYFYRVGVQ